LAPSIELGLGLRLQDYFGGPSEVLRIWGSLGVSDLCFS